MPSLNFTVCLSQSDIDFDLRLAIEKTTLIMSNYVMYYNNEGQ